MKVTAEEDFAELFADLDRLAGFGGSEGGGVSRTAFSPSFNDAQAWLAGRMAEAGLAMPEIIGGGVQAPVQARQAPVLGAEPSRRRRHRRTRADAAP